MLGGVITEAQYFERVKRADAVLQKEETKQSEMRSNQAQAKVAGYLAADAKHWQSVASGNYDKEYTTESKPTLHPAQRTDDLTVVKNLEIIGVKVSKDTKVETKDHGYYTETILRSIETAGANTNPQISKYLTIGGESYKVPASPATPKIPVRTNTSSRKGVNEANIAQKQHVQDIRDGKISLYQALTNPQTPQMVSKNNTINLNQYLHERGYDVTKPETIPNSVLMDRVKYDAARQQARNAVNTKTPMGDLRKYIPSQPQVPKAVAQQRQEALENSLSKMKGGSFIGYGDDGTPIQGAPFLQQQYQVTTPDGKVRTFNSLEHAQKFSQRMTTTQY